MEPLKRVEPPKAIVLKGAHIYYVENNDTTAVPIIDIGGLKYRWRFVSNSNFILKTIYVHMLNITTETAWRD